MSSLFDCETIIINNDRNYTLILEEYNEKIKNIIELVDYDKNHKINPVDIDNLYDIVTKNPGTEIQLQLIRLKNTSNSWSINITFSKKWTTSNIYRMDNRYKKEDVNEKNYLVI